MELWKQEEDEEHEVADGDDVGSVVDLLAVAQAFLGHSVRGLQSLLGICLCVFTGRMFRSIGWKKIKDQLHKLKQRWWWRPETACIHSHTLKLLKRENAESNVLRWPRSSSWRSFSCWNESSTGELSILFFLIWTLLSSTFSSDMTTEQAQKYKHGLCQACQHKKTWSDS